MLVQQQPERTDGRWFAGYACAGSHSPPLEVRLNPVHSQRPLPAARETELLNWTGNKISSERTQRHG